VIQLVVALPPSVVELVPASVSVTSIVYVPLRTPVSSDKIPSPFGWVVIIRGTAPGSPTAGL